MGFAVVAGALAEMAFEAQGKVERVLKAEFFGDGVDRAGAEFEKLAGAFETLALQELHRSQADLLAEEMAEARARETDDRAELVQGKVVGVVLRRDSPWRREP